MLLLAFCVFYFFFGQTAVAANGTCMTDTRADPSNCSLFFDCDVHKSCPNGFLFDSECGFCDVARKVNCSIKQDLTIASRSGAEPSEDSDHDNRYNSVVQGQRKQSAAESNELHQKEIQEKKLGNNHAQATKNLQEKYGISDSTEHSKTTPVNGVNIPIIYIYGVLLILAVMGIALVYWFFNRK